MARFQYDIMVSLLQQKRLQVYNETLATLIEKT
jgi:hypothetical protein